jgi:hypothetical protein
MPYIGNTVQTQGFTPQIDYFSGNGSTVTFTLSRPVVSVAQMIVSIDNVIQNPSSAYTVSGSSITFTSAPLSGTNNIWVEYTSLITTYAALSQSPSVIGDITASGGYLAVGNFGASFVDGTIVDYVTGNGRITAGPADGITLYNGGTSARTALAAWDSSGNLTNTGSIGSPAATALTLKSAGTTAVTIDTSQNVGVGTTSPANKLHVYTTATATPLTIETNGSACYLNFRSTSGSTGFIGYGEGGTANMNFYTANTERMRIDSSGNVIMGNTSYDYSANGFGFGAGNAYSYFTRTSGYALLINRKTTTGTIQAFTYNGSGIGTIDTNGSNCTFNSTSDYRLKQNIKPMTGALARIELLKPVTYNWIRENQAGEGFIAHELQEVVPEAVVGTKDAVDEDGNPVYQAIDQSVLVATLTAAIQELNAKVIALEAKLESK